MKELVWNKGEKRESSGTHWGTRGRGGKTAVECKWGGSRKSERQWIKKGGGWEGEERGGSWDVVHVKSK